MPCLGLECVCVAWRGNATLVWPHKERQVLPRLQHERRRRQQPASLPARETFSPLAQLLATRQAWRQACRHRCGWVCVATRCVATRCVFLHLTHVLSVRWSECGWSECIGHLLSCVCHRHVCLIRHMLYCALHAKHGVVRLKTLGHGVVRHTATARH